AAMTPYVRTLVPFPHRTAGQFWVVSAMPSTNRSSSHQRLAVVNINNVETMVTYRDHGELFGFVNVSGAVFEEHASPRLRQQLRSRGVRILGGSYRTAGGDLLTLEAHLE